MLIVVNLNRYWWTWNYTIELTDNLELYSLHTDQGLMYILTWYEKWVWFYVYQLIKWKCNTVFVDISRTKCMEIFFLIPYILLVIIIFTLHSTLWRNSLRTIQHSLSLLKSLPGSFVLLSLKLDVPCFRFLLRYNTSFDIKELLVSYCCTKKWNETQKHLIVPQV